jgi:6-phosphofructokinase 1
LVRCGHSSVYDVNFGKEAGAAAVVLLHGGMTGVTVAGVIGREIRYMNTTDAIKQRHVDPALVAYHEQLGVCFGRKPAVVNMEFKKIEGKIERPL